jgi:hypothetical protein
MMCALIALTADQISAFLNTPDLANGVVDWAAEQKMQMRLRAAPAGMREQSEAARRQMLAGNPELQREEVRRNAAAQAVEPFGPFEGVLDLGQDWQILHYLFTGSADSEAAPGSALLGGRPLGRDIGYGPPRLHDPAETRAFRDFLAPLTQDGVLLRVDFSGMAQARIYPFYSPPNVEEQRAWLAEIASAFSHLKSYVGAAASKNEGLLIWVS